MYTDKSIPKTDGKIDLLEFNLDTIPGRPQHILTEPTLLPAIELQPQFIKSFFMFHILWKRTCLELGISYSYICCTRYIVYCYNLPQTSSRIISIKKEKKDTARKRGQKTESFSEQKTE